MAMDRHLVRMRADGIDAKKNKKKKTASGEKQSLKQSMDGQLESDHLDCRQLLDKQESRRQCHFDGLSDKAELQLHASVGAVLKKSAERVPRFVFSKDTV